MQAVMPRGRRPSAAQLWRFRAEPLRLVDAVALSTRPRQSCTATRFGAVSKPCFPARACKFPIMAPRESRRQPSESLGESRSLSALFPAFGAKYPIKQQQTGKLPSLARGGMGKDTPPGGARDRRAKTAAWCVARAVFQRGRISGSRGNVSRSRALAAPAAQIASSLGLSGWQSDIRTGDVESVP